MVKWARWILALALGAGAARADDRAGAAEPGAQASVPAEAWARFAALPITRLEARREDVARRSDRDLRETVDAALRIYGAGGGGAPADGLVGAAAPADTAYLVAALIDAEELARRGGGALTARADCARLAAGIAFGVRRAAPSWGALLQAERAGRPADPLRQRSEALAASLPDLVDAAAGVARAHGEAVLAAVPSHVSTLRALGELELATQRWGEAEQLLARAVERDPDAVRARLALGVAQLAGGRREAGEATLAEVVRRHPRLGGMAEAMQDTAAAAARIPLGTLGGAGELPPDDGLALVRDLSAAGFADGALAAGRDLLRARPDDAEVVALVGGLLLEAGRLGDWHALALREPLAGAATPALAELLAAGRFLALLQLAGSAGVAPADVDAAAAEARAALERWAAHAPQQAAHVALLLDVAPALVRARATGGDVASLSRQAAERLVERDDRWARRLAQVLLVGAGEGRESIRIARAGLDGGDVGAALDLADLLVHVGVREGDRGALEEAQALVEGAEARLEAADPCRPGACGARARARITRAQVQSALSVLDTGEAHAASARAALTTASEVWGLLDPTQPAEREAAIAAQLLIARGCIGAGDIEGARRAVELARQDDSAAPDVELFAAVIALLDRDMPAARDLLERALLLGPNPRLELAIRKWRLFVADQLRDRAGFVVQLEALGALWDRAVPPELPADFEPLVVTGATELEAGWEPGRGFAARVGLTQRVVVAPTQTELTRDVVKSLLRQLAELRGEDPTPDATGGSGGAP